jgi:hypothetical protein
MRLPLNLSAAACAAILSWEHRINQCKGSKHGRLPSLSIAAPRFPFFTGLTIVEVCESPRSLT